MDGEANYDNVFFYFWDTDFYSTFILNFRRAFSYSFSMRFVFIHFILRFHKLLQLRVTFPLCLLYLPCSVSIYNVITSHLRRTVVVVELTKKISLEQIL